MDESKYIKYKDAIINQAEWIKNALENLEKIKGYVKIVVSKKDFIKELGIIDIDEDIFLPALKYWLYRKGIVVEVESNDILTFRKVTFSIMIRGIIEDVYKEQKVMIIKIGNVKLWVEHFPEWDYLPGDWVEMRGRYCGTVVLGDEGIQKFICDEIKIININNEKF